MNNINQIVNTFKKKGIAKGKAEILSIDEIQKLQELILNKKSKYLEKNEVYHNIIGIDKKYFRETEVNNLIGNYKKAKKILSWSPEISLDGFKVGSSGTCMKSSIPSKS